MKKTSQPKYSNEEELLVQGLLEQKGLSLKDFHSLTEQQKTEIVEQIRLILSPVIADIFGERADIRERINSLLDAGLNEDVFISGKNVSVADVQLLHAQLGTEKWHRLSHIVSYVKTLLSETIQKQREEAYQEHLAFGVDAYEIKRTLSHVHDVYPARIDTDIKHQSSKYYRAVVELVSNALDASVKNRSPIGRFGIGFYQILNHLKKPEDRVIVTTKTSEMDQGIRIEFRNRDDDIDFRIMHDDSIAGNGTSVEVRSNDFEGEQGKNIVTEYFQHTQDIRLRINGEFLNHWHPKNRDVPKHELPVVDVRLEDGKCIVADAGRGMNTRTVFEKLFVPKLSDKPPVYELRESGQLPPPKIYYELQENEDEKGSEVIVQVGGIMVEKKSVSGCNTVKTLVIDLPPSTILGEQRDEIEVDANTIQAMRESIDQAVTLPVPECFSVINSLASICKDIQARSRLPNKEDNIFMYLQKRVRETFPDTYFLPNTEEFLELDVSDKPVALLDSTVHQTPPKSIPGVREVLGWVSPAQVPLLQAKFKKGSKLGLIANRDFIIIDEKSDPVKQRTLINEALSYAGEWSSGKIHEMTNGDLGAITTTELKEYERLSELLEERWEELYFGSSEMAARQAKRLETQNSTLVNAFTKQVLSKLPSGAATEAMDILEWYVYEDKREAKEKLAEIERLNQNIAILMSNPIVAEALRTHLVPLFSMFEPMRASLPQHIRDNWRNFKKKVSIEGKTYYLENRDPSSSHRKKSTRYVSEDGDVVHFPGEDDVLFKDGRITVYKDRIVNTQTQEEEVIQHPFSSEWGEVKFSFEPKQFRGEPLNSSERHIDNVERVKNTNELVARDGRVFKINHGILSINGEQIECFGGIENVEQAPFKELVSVSDGSILVIAHNQDPYHEKGTTPSYDRNDKKGEQFTLINEQGEVVWKYNAAEFGEKVITADQSRSDRDLYLEEDSQWLQEHACQVLVYSRGKTISAEQPLIRLVRYIRAPHAKYRETIGYIDGSGRFTHIEEAITQNVINPLTLKARHAWESGCECCGAERFEVGEDNNPFREDDHMELLTVQPQKHDFTIVGEFYFDDESQQWMVPATTNTTGVGTEHHVACFNLQGDFIKLERIGKQPSHPSRLTPSTPNPDYRDIERCMVHRMPKAIADSIIRNSGLSNETYLRRAVDIGKRTLIAKFGDSDRTELTSDYEERDKFQDGILSNTQSLSPEHVEALGDFLAQYPVPDRDKLERLFYRVMQYRDLPVGTLKMFLPVFYEQAYIPGALLRPSCARHLEKFAHIDSNRFIQLIQLFDKALPEDEQAAERLVERATKFYAEKLLHEPPITTLNIITNLGCVKEYSNAIYCDGYTIVKNNRNIPPHEVSKEIRPFLTFMQKEDEQLAEDTSVLDVTPTEKETLRLSEIIQWKRLREGQARKFDGAIGELGDAVRSTCEGKNREHIIREVTHAIHFQALNSTDVYIRELVQNAVDVMKSAGRNPEERKITTSLAVDDENDLVFQLDDPVGMDQQTLINYFLVPGETTKLDKQSIGFYGQGVYTLFKDAKEVRVKSSKGDGTVWHLTMRPVIEHALVIDVEIDFASTQEDFTGTVVTKKQRTQNPYVEAAYIHDSMMTLTSSLSDEYGSIYLQGEKINAPYKKLSSEHVEGLGQLSIYANPNNTLTQYGLYLQDIDHECWRLVPQFMSDTMKHGIGGIAIDLPDGIELTRSRQDIANKEKVMERLNPSMQRSLVRTYFNYVQSKIEKGSEVFPLDQLPYDYFVTDSYSVPSHFHSDVHALLSGQPLAHIDEYANGRACIQFMTLLPMFRVGGSEKEKLMSLDAIRRALLSESHPFDKEHWDGDIPWSLANVIRKQLKQNGGTYRQWREQAEKELEVPDKPLDTILENPPEELKEWLEENVELLKKLDAFTKAFIGALTPVYFPGRNTNPSTFYYSGDQSRAHASRFLKNIGWNMKNLHFELRWLNQYLTEKQAYSEELTNNEEHLLRIIDTLAHEYVHITEELDDWTHDPEMNKNQARILIQFAIQGGLPLLAKAMRSSHEEKKS